MGESLEQGAPGNNFSKESWGGGGSYGFEPIFSNDESYSGSQSLLFNFTNQFSSHFVFDGDYQEKWYVTSWLKLKRNPTSCDTIQWKPWRISNMPSYVTTYNENTSYVFNDPWLHADDTWYNSNGANIGYFDGETTSIDANAPNDLFLFDEWQRFETIYTWPETYSEPGNYFMKRFGRTQPLYNLSGLTRSNDEVPSWRYLRYGIIYSSGGRCPASEQQLEVFYDDMYIDNTLARIEICSSNNYTLSTHCEIQIPHTNWNDSEIEFTANIASFNLSEDLYLFVIDENGDVSPGIEVGGFFDNSSEIISSCNNNNVLNVGEACDDGNFNSNDGCDSTCNYVVPDNGQVHWIDQNNLSCDDSSNGQTIPWCGLAPVDSHVFIPGDSVVFRAGDYNRYGIDRSDFGLIYGGADVKVTDSGTLENPIVIMAYPGEQVILRNEILPTYNIPAWGYAVLATNADYIIIQGFTVHGTMLSSYSNYNIWRNNTLHGIDGSEPSFTGDGNYAALMLVRNEHTLVRNNEFNNFDPEYETSYGNANGVQIWGYTLIPDPINNIVENNEFNNCFIGLFDKDNSRNNIHRKNRFYGSTYAMKIAGQANEGFFNYNLQVYQNLVENSSSGVLWGIGYNMSLHNNVFVNTISVNPGGGSSDTPIEYEFYDSIVSNTDMPILRFNGMTFPIYMNYNLYPDFTSIQNNYDHNYATTLADWQEDGFDLNSQVADPLFVDSEYHLASNSPARGAGRDGSDLGLYPDSDESVVIGLSYGGSSINVSLPEECIDNDEDSFNSTSNCGIVDCDDNNFFIYPFANETCDSLDNDCDSGTLDGIDESWFNDSSICGVGACSSTGNYICQNGGQFNDCNSLPGTTEVCNNSIDDDCDGEIDSDCQETPPEEDDSPGNGGGNNNNNNNNNDIEDNETDEGNYSIQEDVELNESTFQIDDSLVYWVAASHNGNSIEINVSDSNLEIENAYNSFEVLGSEGFVHGRVFFKVALSWIVENNLTIEDIFLHSISSGEDYETREDQRDENFVYLSSAVDILGEFAIISKSLVLEEEKKDLSYLLWVLVGILAIAIGFVSYRLVSNKSKFRF
ncbi:hypothetical protein HOD88_00320 [archaeon]|nr:hypothetical protein [archaeon]